MKSVSIRLAAGALLVLAGIAVVWAVLPVAQSEERALPAGGTPRLVAPGVDTTADTPAGVAASPTSERDEVVAAGTLATTGSLLLTVRWHDREPAADIAVALHRRTRGLPYTAFTRMQTDASGQVRFDGLAPGTYRARTDRDSDLEAEVEAGATADYEVVLERGVDVTGSVVRADGPPAPGARVWLQSRSTSWSYGRIATLAGPDGRFALRSVPAGDSLGALSPEGHLDAPSPLFDLDLVEPVDGKVEIRLTLGGPGGRLVGTVVDRDGGVPIAGARVALGNRARNIDHRGDRVIEQWSPRTVVSGEDGRFTFDGVPAGDHAHAAVATGYGLVRGTVSVAAGATQELRIEMPRAATIFGQVTDEAGHGLPGITVHAFDREPRTPFIQTGQIDFDETFDHIAVRTGEDGSYRLAGAPSGTVSMIAQAVGEESWNSSGSGRPHVHELLDVAAGQDTEWSPILSPGRTVEGTALYRDGHPLGGQFVTIRTTDGVSAGTLLTGKDGRFRFVCLTAPMYDLYVQVFDKPKDAPPVERKGVVPDHGPVEIRATFDRPAKEEPARVTGRVVDTGQRLTNPRAATVLLVTASNSWYTSQLDDEGRFAFDRVTPGRNRLVVMDGETAVLHGEGFEVAPAQDLDVGVLTTSAEVATVRVTLRRGADTEAMQPSFYLQHTDGRRGSTVKPGTDSTFEAGNLEPGDYRWSLYCKGAVSRKGEVTLRPDQVADVTVDLSAGAPVRFDVQFESTTELGDVTVVYERDGAEFDRTTYQPKTALDFRRYYVGKTLPPGDWRAVMTTTTGLRAEARFTIASPDDELAPVLELR